jgi:glutamyl-tRNA synthetase
MGLFNIRPLGFHDSELRAERLDESVQEPDLPILQWVPAEENVPVSLVLPDATNTGGYAEIGLKTETVGSVVQFVRFGFCRVDQMSSDKVRLYFAHN